MSANSNDPLFVALSGCVTLARALGNAERSTPSLVGSPSWDAAIGELTADKRIAPRINQPWNTVHSGVSELRPDEIIEWFVRECVEDDSKLIPTFAHAVGVLRDGVSVVDILVPLLRVTWEGEPLPLGTFTLRQATAAERLVHAGADTMLTCAVPTKQTSETNYEKSEALASRYFLEARTVIDALHLFAKGSYTRLSAPWFFMTSRWPGGGGSQRGLARFDDMPMIPTTIELSDAQRLQSLVDMLAKAPKALRIAARRFGASRRESDFDERILALMSAAEALYLPNENTESSFKLGLRAAFFVDVEGVKKRAVFASMRSAYNVRSKLAHGSDTDREKRLGLDGANLQPHEFVVMIDDLVHRGILRALEGGVPDWDALVLGS